jgi:hypothetical protein
VHTLVAGAGVFICNDCVALCADVIAASHRDDEDMQTTWTISELYADLERFEHAARSAGLAESSIRTYVDRSRNFVRWLAGDFQFHGPR